MAAIWKKSIHLDALNALGENSLVAHLGIVFTVIGDDYLEATMPVDARISLLACCMAGHR